MTRRRGTLPRRWPALLCGLAAFAAGTVLCLFAQNAEMLLLGRAVQGIGASGGPVVARAILRDLFSGRQLAANIALATMVFAFGPIVAPLAGVVFMQFGSWRMIFAAILLFGLILLAVGLLFLPETLARANPGATPEPTADAPPPPEPPNTADSREARWVAVPFCTG